MTQSSPPQASPPNTAVSLWSDDPSVKDLLSFDAFAQTLVDPLVDRALDPVALGLSGPWGSGKSTVLGLVEILLHQLDNENQKILVIPTQPWRYDPSTGAKETLIGEVIDALHAEIQSMSGPKENAERLVTRLAKRVDWAKAIKIAAKASIAMQIPSVDDLMELVKPKEVQDGEAPDRSLDSFRREFAELMASEELAHIRAVVVLVDDLDRCLPRTVVESLEAIRLFLAVSKMSFVIAADEHRVADALRSEFPVTSSGPPPEDAEDPAELYLHKIVQTTLPIPALSRFDTQAFILLLQIQNGEHSGELERLSSVCAELRKQGGSLDDLDAADAQTFDTEVAFAARMTPLLYEKLRGNPRRIKRFLNDLFVRQSVAARRGIELDPGVVAKLMILEVLFRAEFNEVIDWLAKGELRSQMLALEQAAGQPDAQPVAPTAPASAAPSAPRGSGKAKAASPAAKVSEPVATETTTPKYSEALLRWAKLPPSVKDQDLAPYLYLAASFDARPLVERGLPERLKDIAANLLGSTKKERQAVSDDDLRALPGRDVTELSAYLGRLIRDQPSRQRFGVTALLRLARFAPDGVEPVVKAMQMIPVDDLNAGTPMLVSPTDAAAIYDLLASWRSRSTAPAVNASIDEVLKARTSNGH